jgi:uncharacterized protein
MPNRPEPPGHIALFPLSAVLFPYQQMPLQLFEPRYLKLMEERRDLGPAFGIVLTRRGLEVGDQPDVHDVGTSAHLSRAEQLPDGRWVIVVTGGRTSRVLGVDWRNGYATAEVEWLPLDVWDATAPTRAIAVIAAFESFITSVLATSDHPQPGRVPAEVRELLARDPLAGAYLAGARLPINLWQRQELLELQPGAPRLAGIAAATRREQARLATTGVMTTFSPAPPPAISPN